MNAIDTPARHLADTLTELLDHERRALVARRSATDPRSASLRRAEDALHDARQEAARVLVSALTLGGTWTLRTEPDAISVDHEGLEPARGPAPEPARSTSSSPPADPRSIARLAQQLGSGGRRRDVSTPAPAPSEPLGSLPRPTPIDDLDALRTSVTRFEAAVGERQRRRSHPHATQHVVRTLLAALGRHLQQSAMRIEGSGGLQQRVSRKLCELDGGPRSKRRGRAKRPAPQRTPRHGSWLDEARAAWDDLFADDTDPDRARAALSAVRAAVEARAGDEVVRNLTVAALSAGVSTSDKRLLAALSDRQAALHGCTDAGIPTLRTLLQRHLQAERDARGGRDRLCSVPDGWAWASRTRDRRVLVLGGDRCDEVVERWRRAFGFGEVIWDTGLNVRRVQASVARVRSGNVDLVLIVRRFVAHKATDVIVPVCKEMGVPFVPIEAGYGSNQLKRAIERHVTPER